MKKRLLAAGAWLGLLGLAVAGYVADRAGRRPAEALAAEVRMEVRRPDVVATMRLAPTADQAAAVLADSIVRDAMEPVPFAGLAPEERRAWLEAVTRTDEALEGARKLLAGAVAVAPGFAYHRLMLGQAVWEAERRKAPATDVTKPERWVVPLRLAAAAAPGEDWIWSSLAGSLLEGWDTLSEARRREAGEVVRRAFLSGTFVEKALLATISAFGRDAALALVPDEPAPLRASMRVLRTSREVEAQARLYQRWEKAELASRAADLAKAEGRYRLGDAEGLRAACRAWAAAHVAREVDRKEERRQAGRVLELWPDDTAGPWRGDPRGELVRFFLDGRQDDVPPRAVARAVAALTNVPETFVARASLLAGDRYAFEQVLRRTEAVGSFSWTPFFVELSRHELKAGRKEAATEALARLSPSARGECEVLLARREVAAATRDEAEEQLASDELAMARRTAFGRDDWSDTRSLPLCLDPERDGKSVLKVDVAPVGAAGVLVAWGWDGGRIAARLVREPEVIELPLAGVAGRRAVTLEVLAGEGVEVGGARIVAR